MLVHFFHAPNIFPFACHDLKKMSSIEELEISGVRSFDPNGNRASVIFFKPLTVILGNNGAGKTTIIECLLNATAGKFPPGCGTERSSFVYDPKVIGDNTVKAQIRLKFTARDGNLCRVIRSYEVASAASKKSDKPKFCSLDTVISQRDEKNGVFAHANFGGAEADARLRDLLGVPSSVLEHVIFCHQEDCNWPLGSASDVKPIFDAIFAATRYVAALDNLKDNNKRMSKELKEYERTLIELRQSKEQAAELRESIKKREESVRILEMRNKGMEPQVQELRVATATIDTLKSTVDALTVTSAQIEGRIHEKLTQLKRINLGSAPKQSLHELLEMRRNFHSHMDRLDAEARQKAATIDVMESSRKQQDLERTEWQSSVASLERDTVEYRSACAKIHSVAASLMNEFVIGEGQLDERSLHRVHQIVKEKQDESHQSLQDAVARHTQQEGLYESSISEILRTVDADAKEREMKEKQIQVLQNRILSIEKEKGSLAQDEPDAIELECSDLQRRLDAAVAIRQQGADYALETSLNTKMEETNTQIARLRLEILERKRISAQEARVPFLRERINQQEMWILEQLQSRVTPGLAKCGREPEPSASTSTLCLAVERLRDQKKESHRIADREVLQLEHEVGSLTIKERSLREEQATTELDYQRQAALFSSAVGPETGIDQFDAVLKDAEDKQLKHCRHLSSVEAMARCYENFVTSATNEKQCVVCKRGLSDAALSDFIRLNEERQRTTPDQIEKARRDLNGAQERLKKLKDAAFLVKELRRLQLQITSLTANINQTIHDVSTKRALLGDALNKRRELEEQLGLAQELFDIASSVNSATSEVSRMRNDLAAAEAINSEGRLSLEELESEYDSLMKSQQLVTSQLQEIQRRRAGGGDEYAIQLELTKRRNALLDARASHNHLKSLMSTISSMEQEISEHRSRLREIATRKGDLQDKIDKNRSALQQLRSAWEKDHHILQHARDQADQQANELSTLIPLALRYFSRKTADALTRAKESLKACEGSCAQVSDEILAMRADVAKLHGIVADQHHQFANLNNHIQHLELQNSLEDDRKHLADATDELVRLKKDPLRGLGHVVGHVSGNESIQTIRDALQDKINELERARAQSEGSAEAIRAEIAEMQHKLGSERFHTIDDRYSSIFIKLQTLELAIADIDKYYKALDKAVQSYHQDKIQQVNAIISELWRSIYRGCDIDTVELKSEVDGVAATASGASKRNYNYRVVMKRGNNEIDMRAKCSAGQKVLASVVIRVALSEAFSSDCGVLALDEPTTNLDEDNSRSLAEALRDLIAARKNSRSFQLVVITHDEQFVRALGSQSSIERFYFVHKDREGAFSKIEVKSFEQLFA